MTVPIDEKNNSKKTIFVSYSWDSDDHKNRVLQFVSKLRAKGLNVTFDKDMMYGDRMTHFMEKAVAESDIVLFICTPEYKKRADGRKGGVGYESAIITGELYETQNERKFIPVLFSGSWEESMPIWAKGKLGIDLRNNDNKEYENIIQIINNFNSDNTTFSDTQVMTAKIYVKKFLVIFIILVVIAFIAFAFHKMVQINDSMSTRLEDLEKRLEYELDRMLDLETSLYNTREDIKNISLSPSDASSASRLVPMSQFTNEIVDKFVSTDISFNSSISLDTTSLIAYDMDTEKEYTTEELANQQLLFTYDREGQEVFFCGQISEVGQLDGKCIVNVYEDNKLVLITDAEYDNGTLLKYKKAFPCTTTSGQAVWAVTNQISHDDFNSSEIWYYFYNNDYNQDFDSNHVVPEDIITVETFSSSINTSLEGYYCGNTSNGYFNDNTGNAYMVKFSEDGTVRMLYVGNFVEGQFNDDTGNAWLIAKSDTNYFYYKGRFNNGMRIDDGVIEAFISQEQIEQIVGEKHFNCELSWSSFESL